MDNFPYWECDCGCNGFRNLDGHVNIVSMTWGELMEKEKKKFKAKVSKKIHKRLCESCGASDWKDNKCSYCRCE